MTTIDVPHWFSWRNRLIRIVAIIVAAASIGGFVVGWVAIPRAPTSLAPLATVPSSSPLGLAQVTHSFSLLPADLHCDLETPSVAADAQGRVLVAWASQTGDSERTIMLARSSDGGTTFKAPKPFRSAPFTRYGRGWTTNVAPRLAATQSAFYLGWVEAARDGAVVKYLLARSEDGGRTFSEPVCVHGTDALRPGFTSLSAGSSGTVCCAWLDGRNQAQQPFVSVSHGAAHSFQAEQMVSPGPDGKGVCPCCNLAVLDAGAGITFAAFRNTEGGNRDVFVSRGRSGGGFEPPAPVTDAHWPFRGCPHDGPSLALSGDRLHVLWMDAHTGKRRVYHADTSLAELRFSADEVNPSAPGEQGHPCLAAGSDGGLHAVWDEGLPDESGAAQEVAASKHDHSGPPDSAAKAAPGESEASVRKDLRAEHDHSGSQQHAGHQHGTELVGGGRAIVYAQFSPGDKAFQTAKAVAPRPKVFQLNPALAVAPSGEVCVVWSELTADGKSIVFARLAQ